MPARIKENLRAPGLRPDDFEQILTAAAGVMDAMGEVAVRTGEIEQRAGGSLDNVMRSVMSRVKIEDFVAAMNKTQMALFVRISFRLASFGKADLNKLSPEEKIRLGKEWKAAAGDLRELTKILREGLGSAKDGRKVWAAEP